MTPEEITRQQATMSIDALQNAFKRAKHAPDYSTYTITLPAGNWNLIDHLLHQIEKGELKPHGL